MGVDVPSFGERVRAARRERGLSQEQLGSPAFSRSYMSLLESGLRPPTHEVISHIAMKFGLDRDVVQQWHVLESGSMDIEAAVAQVEVLGAFVGNDLSDISHWASRLSDVGEEEGRVGLWWTSAFVRLMCLHAESRYDEAIDAAAQLQRHWITVASPALAARVQGVQAQVHRARGDLDDAVQAARAAIQGLSSDPDATGTMLPCWTTLVTALAELGRLNEAFDKMATLRGLAEQGGGELERGRAHWALGNLEFLAGRYEEGAAEHRRAIALIDPDRHLRLWGRLHRSSASMRIKCGAPLDEVAELLRVATAVASISSTATDRAELLFTEGLYAVCRREWGQARERLERALDDADQLAPQMRAEAHETLAVALEKGGDPDAAEDHYREAVALFSSVGAFARALDICRDHAVTPPRISDAAAREARVAG